MDKAWMEESIIAITIVDVAKASFDCDIYTPTFLLSTGAIMLSPNAKEWTVAAPASTDTAMDEVNEAAAAADAEHEAPKTPPLTATSAATAAATAATAATGSSTSTPKSTRICKNVIIYGYCKFEGKGCQFNHN
ncbi:hypothetical protein SYNPS1DRAFT_30440, partial [Syncephalis pseudoplumigaleata]